MENEKAAQVDDYCKYNHRIGRFVLNYTVQVTVIYSINTCELWWLRSSETTKGPFIVTAFVGDYDVACKWVPFTSIHIQQRQTSKEKIASTNVIAHCELALIL